MILTVLSDKSQYTALLANFVNCGDIAVLCDNPSFYAFLQKNNINFEALGEDVLRQKWESINTWACEKALLGNCLTKEPLFNGVELDKALYVYFSYYLASFLKNYLLAEFIYNKYKPKKIIVFKYKQIPDFPEFNGSYFLNIFLTAGGKNHNCEVVSLECDFPASLGSRSVKEKIRFYIQNLYSRLLIFKARKKIFLIRGALKNLKSVMTALGKQGYNVCFYGFEFRFEHFWFCLRKRIPYLIPECFYGKHSIKDKEEFNYKNDFLELINILTAKQWFRYENTDLTDFVCAQLLNTSDKYLKDIFSWSHIYSDIMSTYDIKGLVTDEDLTPQGSFMAAFLKSQGIKSFCISHGYGPIKFNLQEQNRSFFLSNTFVHSEFEKNLYCSWGWDKAHITVSGIPRYDVIMKLKSAAEDRRKHSKKMKILFVGSTMREYNPTQVSYLGVRQYWVGNSMKVYLKDIIEAIKAYNDIELLVRPHDIGDEKLWLDFIKMNKSKNKVTLISAKPDFLDLASRCDSMILGYWSTAVREGIMFDIPTVIMDYSKNDDAFPFAKANLCQTAKNPQDTKRIIDKIYADFKRAVAVKENNENYKFYLGINDGHNTERVVREIIRQAGS